MKYKVYVDWLTQWGKDYLSHLKQIFQGKLTAGQGVTIDENNVISASGGSDDYYTKTEVNNLISNTKAEVDSLIDKKADSTDLDGYLPLTGGNISGNVKVGGNSIYTTIYGSNGSGSSQDVRLEFRDGYSYGKLIPDDGMVTGNYLRKTNTTYKDHEIVNTVDENTYTLLLPDESGTLAIASKYYTKAETNALLNDKQDVLNFDNTPTENSTNPVTSGGVYNAISKPDLYEVNIFYVFTLDELRIPTEYTQLGYAVYKNGEDITNTITNFKTFVDGLNNTNNILKFYSAKNSSATTNHRELLRYYTNSSRAVTAFNVYNSDVVGTIRFRADEIACTFKESTINVVDRIVEDTYGCNVHIVLDVTNVPHTDIDLNDLMFANVEDYVQTIKYTKYQVGNTSYNYDTEVTYTDSIVKFINNVLPSLNAHYNLSITVEITKSTGESSRESRIFYAEYINHEISAPYDNYLKLSYELDAGDIYDYPQKSMQYAGLIVVPGVEYPERTSHCRIARVDTDIATKQYVDGYFEFLDNYSEEEF